MDMLTTRSCMSLFVLFHQLQKILWSRPWRVTLRMSEPGWYVTSCCLTLRGRNCLSLVLESSNLRSALALFELGTVTLNRRIALGSLVLGFIITYLWVPILERFVVRLSYFININTNIFYNIRQIRKYLSEDSTKTLIHAFVKIQNFLQFTLCSVQVIIVCYTFKKSPLRWKYLSPQIKT